MKRYAFWSLAAAPLLAVGGCSPKTPAPTIAFAEQIEAVRDGRSDEILTDQRLSDTEFEQLATLSSLRRLEGNHVVATPSGLARLAEIEGLEQLVLRGESFDDAALQALAKCRDLQILNLPQAEFSDAGLVALKELPVLRLLRFGSPNVSDAGMPTLLELPSLRFLHMIGVPLTDSGLQPFHTADRLQSLYLDDTLVTDEGIYSLLQAQPRLHVHINQQHSDRDPLRKSHAH